MSKKKRPIFKEVSNKSATYHFAIDAKYEAGMVLTGTEVKSIRDGRVNFNDSFCFIENSGEVYIRSLHIQEYKHGTNANHNPTQDRKLLLNKKEIKKLHTKIKEKGFTIVPLRIFLSESGYIKCEIALARGKKIYDKRDSIKERDNKRDLARGI
jgi:SsrA-binding protein